MTRLMLTSNLTKRRKSDTIMANSWSFLHDELNMSENFEDFYMGGLRGAESADTISFTLPDDEVSFGAAQEVPMVLGGMGEDHISLNLEPEKQNIHSKAKLC